MIGSDERALVTTTFNQTQCAFPADKSLPDLLMEQVRIHVNDVAVFNDSDSLTFGELADRSADIACYLEHVGVLAHECVGVFVDPSIELVVSAWGVLFAGCAYLPLSPEYPDDRLRYMIEDVPAKVVFTQDHLTSRLAEIAPPGTRVITMGDVVTYAASHRRQPPAELEPSSLAYIIYTSGSTGKPKGVQIEHRSVVNQMHWLKTSFGLGHGEVVLQKTPMSFDAAQWEILAPCCGGAVLVGAPGIHRDPEKLIETITKHNVTTLQCVPTLLQALLDTEQLHTCSSLVHLFSGGEALSSELANNCLEALPACDLVNLYGPTECTINSSAFTVNRDTVAEGPATISIGSPVFNTQFYILDRSQSPTAIGETGELYIGGVQVARGYLNRPEMSAAKFVANPFFADYGQPTLYKTGDLAYWNPDGTVQFVGRTDNQVKLRGFRVELDEIKVAIDAHEWVKNSAMVVYTDAGTGFQNLTSFIELNPKEAAVMDQDNHGAHHQSKSSKLQIKAQLSNMGCRDADEVTGKTVLDLPSKESTQHQRQQAFARKTYRFFEGDAVTKADILRLLQPERKEVKARGVDELRLAELGELLRYFGQHLSGERLLPKYGYASPGSLYATQMYFEIHHTAGLDSGYYYYQPVLHQLILIRPAAPAAAARVKVHFVGKRRAIEPVYKNNIQEVLEIEAGHMLGLFDSVLPDYGLSVEERDYAPSTMANLECSADDYYLGSYELSPYQPRDDHDTEVYVQARPGRVADLPSGQYLYRDGDLVKVSDEIVLKKHVIAINQQVYERSSVGITVMGKSRLDWRSYIALGRRLQQLEMNELNLGFMSSGYSSKSSNDLPSAVRIESILRASDLEVGPSYFAVGGAVSPEQVRSEGMKEDVVHMKGPAEMIKDDLVNFLPDYMLPNNVYVVDKLPLTTNGKISYPELKHLAVTKAALTDRPFVAARTETEKRISRMWQKAMKRDTVSMHDDFFESGGNSLIAVGLVNRINRELRSTLPLQVLFEAPTIEKLALLLDDEQAEQPSRLVRLHSKGSKKPVYCWPGLGGYTMNLRVLAGKFGDERPFYGVQAHGVNAGESPHTTIQAMAAADIELMKRTQPAGPYTLWGYSFGARVAFEAAYQLEQAGDQVESLCLVASGSPAVRTEDEARYGRETAYRNKAYVAILFSVFSGTVRGPVLDECFEVATDDESFARFIADHYKSLDLALIRRIIDVVRLTYQFEYNAEELAQRKLRAPITLFKARGDNLSFLEHADAQMSADITVVNLRADHYSVLREPDIGELVRKIGLSAGDHEAEPRASIRTPATTARR